MINLIDSTLLYEKSSTWSLKDGKLEGKFADIEVGKHSVKIMACTHQGALYIPCINSGYLETKEPKVCAKMKFTGKIVYDGGKFI